MGLRSCEIVRIRLKDILGDFDKLRVRLAKTGRIIERIIPNKVKPSFNSWVMIKNGIDRSEWLFPPLNNRSKNAHITTSTIRWKIKKIRDYYGLHDKIHKRLERISAHAFRHYFITQCYNISNHDIILCQNIIGHVRMETTACYIDIIGDDRIRSVINRI